MVQGDKYNIPFRIKLGASITSPSNCDDVIITIDKVQKSYVAQELTYDSVNQRWLYPLTYEQSIVLPENARVQTCCIVSGNRFNSKIKRVHVDAGMIKEVVV